MVIVGLTGSIAMGKSTVGGIFGSLGVPVFDADMAVRAFYSGAGAKIVETHFPGVLGPDGVDRERLAKRVLGNQDNLARLERIVHPEVMKSRREFLARGRSERRKIVVLDIPLLFETGGQEDVDLIAVVSAPADIQCARALDRPDMTRDKLDHILSRQAPDSEKRKRAHVVISTGVRIDETRTQIQQFLRAMAAMEGRRA